MTELNRTIGPVQLMLYGVGSMLGAGIYGLVGKAAGLMGGAVWIAFLLAMAAALTTAVSYASIASRYPKAAGAAYAVQRAYKWPWLSHMVGMTVVFSGIASIATQSKVVAENLDSLVGLELGISLAGAPLDVLLMALAFLLAVAGLVWRGISESLWANAVCTIVEALGLVLIIAFGMRYWGRADLFETPATPANPEGALTTSLLLQGSILTFFSFLGFEDMLNVSEEVKKPQRSVPIAMIGAMLIASAIYIAVAVTAVSVVPWRQLSEAPAPLKLVMERAAPWFPAVGFTFITIAAVANTALVNYVMASRMLYGMASQKLLPAALGRLDQRRRTPHVAIALLFGVVVLLQFAGDIAQLASASVLLLLLVFAVVNGALILLERREGRMKGRFNAPIFVPVLGVVVCVVMIGGQLVQDDWRSPAIAGGLLLLILILHALARFHLGRIAARR